MNILFFLKPKSELAYIFDYHTVNNRRWRSWNIINIPPYLS